MILIIRILHRSVQKLLLAHIPIVVPTALGDKDVAKEAIDLGTAATLTKSCEPRELLETVQEYVAQFSR